MTVKAKHDANQYKQIPDDMQEKGFKAEKGKVITSHRFLRGNNAFLRCIQNPIKHQGWS